MTSLSFKTPEHFLNLAYKPVFLNLYALQVVKKVANVWHPLCNLKGFLFVIVAQKKQKRFPSN